jgi:hypothetical protein
VVLLYVILFFACFFLFSSLQQNFSSLSHNFARVASRNKSLSTMVFPKHKLRSHHTYRPKQLSFGLRGESKLLKGTGTFGKKDPEQFVSPRGVGDQFLLDHRDYSLFDARSPFSDDNSVVEKNVASSKVVKEEKNDRMEIEIGGCTYFETLEARDVLTGRGNGPSDHIGNGAYRGLIEKGMDEYFGTVSRKAKDQIARKIVQRIKARKGHFVRKLTEAEQSKVMRTLRRNGNKKFKAGYILVDDETALRKTKQSFRYTNKTWDGDEDTRLGSDPFGAEADDDDVDEDDVCEEEERPSTPVPTMEAEASGPPDVERPVMPVFKRDTSIGGPPLNVVANLLPRFTAAAAEDQSDSSSSSCGSGYSSDATAHLARASMSSEDDPFFAEREHEAVMLLSAMSSRRSSASSISTAVGRIGNKNGDDSSSTLSCNDDDDESWTSGTSF